MTLLFQLFVICLISCPVMSLAAEPQESNDQIITMTAKEIELCKKFPDLCEGGPGCEDDEDVPAEEDIEESQLPVDLK